jgi:hypothetical protein
MSAHNTAPLPISSEEAPRRLKSASAKPNAKSAQPKSASDKFFDGLIAFFTSLRLTVACLILGAVLVFAGTIAQVDMGLFKAQNEFFRSFFISWGPKGASWKLPVFPGGYLIGGTMLINLMAAFLARFSFTWKKAGILIIHAGMILLLLGQLLTDMLSRESAMQLFEGETKNYSEDFRETELALIDKSNSDSDKVYSIPQPVLAKGEVRDPRLPLTVRVKHYWVNAALVRPGSEAPGAIASGATAGDLKEVLVMPQAPVSDTDQRNSPGAVVELLDGGRSLGSFLVSALVSLPQTVKVGGKDYEIDLRFRRYYHPFQVTLLKATHEKYKGTDIPKNFASRVRVQNPAQNEARETVIYMNNPLRYSGLTFYQYQMSAGEMAQRAGSPPSSTFQVVRNPSWLTPYLSCIMVATGLLVQFGSHLIGFLKRRRA